MAGFTEFYCDAATGANINAGDNKSVVTSTNGDWGNAAANRFTAAAGTPFSGVSVGDFASVYLDGATLAVYIARVTAVNASGASLDLSTTAKSGTAPTTGATGRSCTVGGVWKGPNAAEAFPFGFITSALTNAAGDAPRVNFKGGTNYAITAAMTHANNGPIKFQGYTTTVGDGGRATIDGGTSGAGYTLLTVSATHCGVEDLIFQNNGASGNAYGLLITGAQGFVRRCVFNNLRGSGGYFSGTFYIAECEAYACNQTNAASSGGFEIFSGLATRCISHDNVGSNTSGFIIEGGGAVSVEDCIADTNGSHGFNVTANLVSTLRGCDSYNNTGDGIRLANTTAATFLLENCNVIKNGGYGINGSGAGSRQGTVVNCGFGSGTQANTSGTTAGLKSMVESGSVTYPANLTPWVDPANGDFRINLAAAKNAGRGTFSQTAASYAGTVAYPDIGAAQHQDSGGSTTNVFIHAE